MEPNRSAHRIRTILKALSPTPPCPDANFANANHEPSQSSIQLQHHRCAGGVGQDVAPCYGNHARPFEAWEVGQRLITKRRTINDADVVSYIHLTGYDAENLFGDMVYLKEVAGHSKRLVPGMLTGSIADALIVGSGILDGFAIALASLDNFKAVAPVYAGDTIQVELAVTKVKPSEV